MPGGWIEIITGGMFSGKTDELLKRARKALHARKTIQVFKPALDNRYDVTAVVSHVKVRIEATPVRMGTDIPALVKPDTQVVFIDEAQFLGDTLVDVCEALANGGMRVVVAGLDLDYKNQPFGPMPGLLAKAEKVDKYQAICTVCGGPACRSMRMVLDAEQVKLGAEDMYEARCRDHHSIIIQ